MHSNLSLPRGWIVEVFKDKLTLCKLQQCITSISSFKQPEVITHCLEVGMGNYSINRENCDNLASNNRIITIFLVFNNRKSH